MSDDSPRTPAPGWYPHPADLGSELYWDGSAWTDRSRPSAPQAPLYGTPSAPLADPAGAAYGTPPAAPYGPDQAVTAAPYGAAPSGASPYASSPYASNPYDSTAASGRNPMAVASLVMGILSLVFNVLFVPSILAIVFAVRGRAAATVTGIGRGMATAGLITGIVGIAFGGLMFLVNIAGFLAQLGS